MNRWALVLVFLFPLQAYAAEKGTYIEQKILQGEMPKSTAKGSAGNQPVMEGLQKIWFSAGFLRNEMTFNGQTSVIVFDLNTKRVIIMYPEEKKYHETELEKYQKLVAMRLGGTGLNDDQAKATLTPTGDKKKIEQWECEKLVFEQGGRVSVHCEMWIAKDAGIDFQAYLELMKKLGMDQMLGRLAGFVSKIPGYPIEVWTEQKVDNQKISSTVRVQKIVFGDIDPSLFKVPADFKRLNSEGSLNQ